MNKIIITGNLTRDVELRYTGSGAAIANFGLASSHKWKDKNSGDAREDVCFVDCSVFGRSAEVCNQFLSKGSKVLIEGRLQFEQWQDNNGQKRSKHKISVESFEFLDKKGADQAGAYSSQNNQENTNRSSGRASGPENHNNIDIQDDDIPF